MSSNQCQSVPSPPSSGCLGFGGQPQSTCSIDPNGILSQDMQNAIGYCNGIIDEDYLCQSYQSSLINSFLSPPSTWDLTQNAPRLSNGPCYAWATNPSWSTNNYFQLSLNGLKNQFCAANSTNAWCACILPNDSAYADDYNLIIGAVNDGSVSVNGGGGNSSFVSGDTQCWWFPCKGQDLIDTLLLYYDPALNCPNSVVCIINNVTFDLNGSSSGTINFFNECADSTPPPPASTWTASKIALYTVLPITASIVAGLFIWLIVMMVKGKKNKAKTLETTS